jgi:hypothetical protein
MVAVGIGAILAFIKISIAGVKWSMSDVITDKSEAKKDIQGALLGLAILLIPFIVLNTIYGGLTNLNVLDSAQNVQINTQQSSSGGGGVVNTDPLRTGYTSLNCNFDQIVTGTDMNGAPIYTPDSTACVQQCSNLNGIATMRTDSLTCQYRNN